MFRRSLPLDRMRRKRELFYPRCPTPLILTLARQARVAGDVDLMPAILPDGSVESAEVVGGHPRLTQAALDSAQRSQFECRGCSNTVTSYALKYTFQIVPRDPPKECDKQQTEARSPAEVDPSRHQVKVFPWEIWTCVPTTSVTFGLFAPQNACTCGDVAVA
jgi:TonB-like protein